MLDGLNAVYATVLLVVGWYLAGLAQGLFPARNQGAARAIATLTYAALTLLVVGAYAALLTVADRAFGNRSAGAWSRSGSWRSSCTRPMRGCAGASSGSSTDTGPTRHCPAAARRERGVLRPAAPDRHDHDLGRRSPQGRRRLGGARRSPAARASARGAGSARPPRRTSGRPCRRRSRGPQHVACRHRAAGRPGTSHRRHGQVGSAGRGASTFSVAHRPRARGGTQASPSRSARRCGAVTCGDRAQAERGPDARPLPNATHSWARSARRSRRRSRRSVDSLTTFGLPLSTRSASSAPSVSVPRCCPPNRWDTT